MKALTIVCVDCGKARTFRGVDVDEIIKAVDASDWHDGDRGRAGRGRCPECEERYQKELEDIDWNA